MQRTFFLGLVEVWLKKEILNIEIEVNDEESVDMCYAIEELIRIAAAEKEAEGEKRGVQIGEEKTLRCVAASMLARQIPRDEVIDFLVGTFSMSPEKAMGYLS